VHVLVFAEVCRDFTDFRVELYVNVLLLAKQYCILYTHTYRHTHMARDRQQHRDRYSTDRACMELEWLCVAIYSGFTAKVPESMHYLKRFS